MDDDAAVAEALTLLRASDGMAKAREKVRDYAEQARRELAVLPDVAGRKALASLVDYTVTRHG
jgi:heptaprenyl diphosphate synthase